MGRDWLYRGAATGGGRRREGARPRTIREASEDTSTGCMCAVFQLFELPVPLNQHHPSKLLPGDPFLLKPVNTTKGNSLESKEPITTKLDAKENLNLPTGFKIKTRVSSSDSNSRTEDLSTECSVISSPGTKTPNLVARLMGLDLLPECSSPSLSSSNSGPSTKSLRKDRNLLRVKSSRSFFEDDAGVGVRSLPETPRMSLARRSDSEFHRLSLQINRENIKEEIKQSAKKIRARGRFTQQVQDENRSPGHYAKQIVKQIKESVSRRVGLDITNINRDKHQEIRRDENLILLKPNKKNSRDSPTIEDEISPDGKQAAFSWSPKLRFLDTNKNRQATNLSSKSPRISTLPENHRSLGASNPLNQVNTQEDKQQRGIKKFGSGNSCSSLRTLPNQSNHLIRRKKEEPYVRSPATNKANFIDRKSKKVPLSSELLNTSCSILLPVKKHPSPPDTKLPQKQAQFSSRMSQSYKQLHLKSDKLFTDAEPGGISRCATTQSAATAEYRYYVRWILNRAGIVDNFTPLHLGKWHTPLHPLEPSIFYYLELFHPAGPTAAYSAVLSHRCNRKLVFQLVDELLADILRPHLDFRPWITPSANDSALLDKLCNKIEGFPAADCRVLEDIDSLIGKDLGKSQTDNAGEEWERLVCDIEGELMDVLVHETAEMIGGRTEE